MDEENLTEEKKRNKKDSVYDQTFKKLVEYCPDLIVPMINEMFGTKYSKSSKITILNGEFQVRSDSGKIMTRRADALFEIMSEDLTAKKYHIECQSKVDKNMIVRIFEYATQISLQELTEIIESGGTEINLQFPRSALLYLRSWKTTPDKFVINIEISDQKIPYEMPIMKVKSYSVEDIFEKDLLFLIPFHLFALENKFAKYEKDEKQLEELKQEYAKIVEGLDRWVEEGKIGEFYRTEIYELTRIVAEQLAQNHQKVLEGVGGVMGGKMFETKAEKILKEGIQEGIREGIQEGELKKEKSMLQTLVKSGKMSKKDLMSMFPHQKQYIQTLKA